MSRPMSKMKNGFVVYEERCEECLFSSKKIVDNARRKALLESCAKDGTYFQCHKATLTGDDVCCRGFYDVEGSSIVQIAKLLDVVRFVPLPVKEK